MPEHKDERLCFRGTTLFRRTRTHILFMRVRSSHFSLLSYIDGALSLITGERILSRSSLAARGRVQAISHTQSSSQWIAFSVSRKRTLLFPFSALKFIDLLHIMLASEGKCQGIFFSFFHKGKL